MKTCLKLMDGCLIFQKKKVPKIAYLTLNKNIVGFVLTGKIKKHYQLISTIDQKISVI